MIHSSTAYMQSCILYFPTGPHKFDFKNATELLCEYQENQHQDNLTLTNMNVLNKGGH